MMIVNEISPIKPSKYIEQCLNLNQNIQIYHHYRFRMIIIILFHWLFIVKLFSQYLYRNSQKYRLLTIDITYLFNLDDFINLISIPLIFMIQYFFHIFYLKFNQRLFNIIWKIFHNHQCNEYFLYPTFHYSQSSYNCCSFIYKNSYRFLYAFQPIIILLNVMIIILHFIYLKIFIENYDQPIFWENLQIFIIQLAIAEFNCLFTLFIWFCMAHILILATVVLFIFASVIFIKLDQCNQLIKSIMYRMIMILKNGNNRLHQQQLFINY